MEGRKDGRGEKEARSWRQGRGRKEGGGKAAERDTFRIEGGDESLLVLFTLEVVLVVAGRRRKEAKEGKTLRKTKEVSKGRK